MSTYGYAACCSRCGQEFRGFDLEQVTTDAEQCDHRMRVALHPKLTPCHSPMTKAKLCTCGTRCIFAPVIQRGGKKA